MSKLTKLDCSVAFVTVYFQAAVKAILKELINVLCFWLYLNTQPANSVYAVIYINRNDFKKLYLGKHALFKVPIVLHR